jgi:hypothetical protein
VPRRRGEGQNLALEQRWAKHRHERLPGLAAELVQAFYGFEVNELRRRAAYYVDRILKGARPTCRSSSRPGSNWW